MRRRNSIKHASAALLTAALLGGCGIIPVVAQQSTAAALRPVTTVAQWVATDLQIMGNLARGATASSREVTMATQSIQRATPVYAAPTAARTVSYARPKKEKDDARATANWDIPPAAVLARLTPDQADLQRAAQREAVKALIGETIFWKLDGREGSAMTKSENKLAAFTCRTFEQTVKFDDAVETARATACRTESTGWTRSF